MFRDIWLNNAAGYRFFCSGSSLVPIVGIMSPGESERLYGGRESCFSHRQGHRESQHNNKLERHRT